MAAIGFASARPMGLARRVIEERKAAGLHAGMQFTYRAPDRSTDPGRALRGAVSLVVGAWPYPPPQSSGGNPREAEPYQGGRRPREAEPQRGGGRALNRPLATVAAYARDDYYAELRAALGVLASVLRGHGWLSRVLVDDNALVDRAAAHRAGLGWFGKNCNILLPDRGSFFVLGSVVTDAPLPVDEPVPDGCGGCRRCQVACPTGALIGPGVLDARKCLAWLLQAAGPFPFEYREALGDRIYGCDDCQTTCPVNKRASCGTTPALEAPGLGPPHALRGNGFGHGGASQVDLLELLSMTDAELLDRFGRWYIPKRDPRYLRRNALVVLGNVALPQDPEVEAALLHYLLHPDELLRAHAVWAALRLGRGDLVDATQTSPAGAPQAVQEELRRRDQVEPRRTG
jgi:epoxyqueuosine reductase